jgi:hypothetical protein
LLWEHFKFGGGSSYPPVFTNVIIPVYFIIIIISIALFSGYRLPSKTKDTVPGVISGTIIILIIYALLPLNLRFSRAVIIAGGLFSLISMPGIRWLV